jgi:hypothetical protein
MDVMETSADIGEQRRLKGYLDNVAFGLGADIGAPTSGNEAYRECFWNPAQNLCKICSKAGSGRGRKMLGQVAQVPSRGGRVLPRGRSSRLDGDGAKNLIRLSANDIDISRL